jgi:hypothetical protein
MSTTDRPGTPSDLWVCEVDIFDQEQPVPTHSVAVFPTRAQAATWAEQICQDERDTSGELYAEDDTPIKIEETHEQPYLDQTPDYEHWISTWVCEPENARWRITVQQLRFGYAYITEDWS